MGQHRLLAVFAVVVQLAEESHEVIAGKLVAEVDKLHVESIGGCCLPRM
jgi:hypothetical protein